MLIFCINPCVRCPAPIPGEEGLGISPNPNDPQNPFVNLSSERPDVNLFLGNNGYGGPGLGQPPFMGGVFQSTGCISPCFSTVSQAAADLCAFNQNVICNSIVWPEDPGVGPDICVIRPDLCKPVQRPLFGNDAQQCTVNCSDGSPFTFIIQAGAVLQFSQNEANALAFSLACQRAQENRLCMSALNQTICCKDQTYLGQINISSGIHPGQPYGFAVTAGALPPGVALAPGGTTSVLVAGIPTVSGIYTFTIMVTHPTTGVAMTKQYTISVIGIATAALLDGETGVPYSQTMTGEGAVGTIIWSISVGALPAGLTLNNLTGEISGTPTTVQTSGFTVVMSTLGVQCRRSYTVDITGEVCPALDATIALPFPFVGLIGSKNPATFRALVSCNPNPTQLIDTQNNVLLPAPAIGVIFQSGCYAITPDRFIVLDAAGDTLFADNGGNAIGGSLAIAGASTFPAYNVDDDEVYVLSNDMAPDDNMLNILDPNAASAAVSLVSSTSLGIGDILNAVMYCPTPKSIFAVGQTGGGPVLRKFALPGLAMSSLNLGTNAFGLSMIFVPSTGKVYLTGLDTLGNAILMEIDPVGMTLDFVYNFGTPFFSADYVDYNPANDRIYFVNNGSTDFFVIDPVARSVVCTETIPAGSASGPVWVDAGSGSILLGDTLSNVLVYHD